MAAAGPDYRAACGAAASAFFITGLVFGTWAARVPAVKTGLGLSDGELAVAFVGLNAGAVAGLQVGAVLVSRLGSRATVRAALPAFALLLPLVAAAPSLPVLIGALAAFAGVCGVADVASNANGVSVERRYGRTVLSRLHAMYTLGCMVGAGGGALAAFLTDGLITHFAVVAVAGAAAAWLAARWLVPDEAPAGRGSAGTAGGRPGVGRGAGWVAGLGCLAFCVTLAEGSADDWTAVYLHEVGAGHAFAAIGVATFLAAMTLGRLVGDRLRARVGGARLFRCAALFAAVGFAATLPLHRPAAGLVGFALLGLGLSVTLPVVMAAASHRAADAGLSPATVVARVSTIAYLGSFAGPALIGLLAALTSLGAALFVSALLVAAAALFAGALAGHDPEPAAPAAGWTASPRSPASRVSQRTRGTPTRSRSSPSPPA